MYIMKQEFNDWLLRLVRIELCGKGADRVVSHICLYDMPVDQVMELAEEYRKICTVVRVFRLESII